MEKSWELSSAGFIKINVHAVYYNAALPNGNNSGIGVVLRDEDGDIILMVSGTKMNLTERANELWPILIGLRCALYENENKVILETESSEAVKEWDDWRWFIEPNHRLVIEQLVRRRKDKKLLLNVDVIEERQNQLARFLAVDGAMNRNRLVIFHRTFGRVREIWHLGLGSVDEEFDLLEEDEYMAVQQQQIEQEGMADWLGNDVGSGNDLQ